MTVTAKPRTAAVLLLLFLSLSLLCACAQTPPATEPDEPTTPDVPILPDEPPVEVISASYERLMDALRLTEGEPLVPLREEALTFSLDAVASAFFNTDRILEIGCAASNLREIRYTSDGSTPTATHGELVCGPITLYAGTLPKVYHFAACAVYADGSTSEICYRTYFVGTDIVERFNMLVFYVDAAEEDLWSAETGIFHQNNIKKSGREWERPMHVQLFDSDGTELLHMPAGIRIYGGYSRAHALKSMRYIARKDYDSVLDDFNVLDLFGPLYTGEGVRIDKLEHLVVRNSGNDFGNAFMNDELTHKLMAAQGFAFTEPVRPCLVYVNGTLYGMYWMHEPYKDSYFENRFEQYGYRGEFVVLDGPEREKEATGDEHIGYDPLADYNEMMAYGERDLTDETTYAALCERLDVESYLQLHATMGYINNGDWPQNNNRAFKYFAATGEAPSDVYGMDGKWYFLPHDTDWAFGTATADSFRWCYDEDAIQYSPLFCALMERDDCRVTYVTYLLDMMNGAFSPERAVPLAEEMIRDIRPGLELYLAQSPYLPNNFDIATFDRRSARVVDFLKARPANVVKHIDALYGLGKSYTLTVDVSHGGGVQVNNYLAQGDFRGTYYTYYPTTISPIVPVGYEFDHWLVNGVRRNAKTLTLEDAFTYTGCVAVEAVLRRAEGLRVTAIGYDGEDDYVVLTNLGKHEIGAGGYYLTDKDIAPMRYALPDVTVPAGKSIVIYGEDFSREREGGDAIMSFDLAKEETLCLSVLDETGEAVTLDCIWLPPKMQDTSSYERDLTSGRFYEVLAGEK